MTGTIMIDFSGRKFSRLTVVSEVLPRKANRKWNCICDCGEKRAVWQSGLLSGATQSCGCFHRDRLTTHGMRYTSTYRIWINMRVRCENPKDPFYKDYGGRGIRVCNRWEKFENFLADMGPRPSLRLTLDRKNNDGPYCKKNCKWSTASEQAKNRRPRVRMSNGQYAPKGFE